MTLKMTENLTENITRFQQPKISAINAKFEAQKIAFGPVVFQVARIMKKMGILKIIAQAGSTGIDVQALSEKTKLNSYQLRVLLETSYSAGIITLNDEAWSLTKIGYFLQEDEMFEINAEFIHEVCYLGLADLEDSLLNAKPEGLKAFGKWDTVYQALSSLPKEVKDAWLRFDHFYSDSAFTQALPCVFESNPKNMMDIGCNTGKWALQVLNYSKQVSMTLVDLEKQLQMCYQNLEASNLSHRVSLNPRDVLDTNQKFPDGCDAIWMSQFLVCFDECIVESILKRAAQALEENGFLFIMDTFWDIQDFDVSSYCLINTSPYFTAIANGVSKMFTYKDILRLTKRAGLTLDKQWNNLGISHTLLRFRPSKDSY